MPNITDEATPTAKSIRVGIELEGFGRINTKWETGEEVVIQEPSFYNVFKRTPLVRSNSFNEASGLGVYLTPEDADQDYGLSSPVELVSNPHPFTLTGLGKLSDSVRKAMLSTSPMRKAQTATLRDKRAPVVDPVSGKIATSKWEYHRAKIGRNLQTTIGVSVEKLLSIKPKVRELAAQTLILDENRRSWLLDLVVASVAMQRTLTEVGGPLENLITKKERLGLRLAIFMYLIRVFARYCLGKKVWAKDAFGANFKGYSSFIGCGAANNNDILKAAYGVNLVRKAEIQNDLLEAVRVAAPQWLDTYLTAELDIDNIGQPGLSTQTAVQEWFSIPNFYVSENLYTVVESREGESLLNQQMAQFLNGTITTSVFREAIKARLHL